MLDPNADSAQWRQMTDAVHPYVLSHVISSEGFIRQLYDDNGGRGTLTIGSGFTLNDKVHRDFAKKYWADILAMVPVSVLMKIDCLFLRGCIKRCIQK